jgi:hypothetical protein
MRERSQAGSPRLGHRHFGANIPRGVLLAVASPFHPIDTSKTALSYVRLTSIVWKNLTWVSSKSVETLELQGLE